MSTKTLWTVEMLERLPDDDYRYELDEGRLIRMSPSMGRHGRVSARIMSRLGPFVEQHDLGEVYILDHCCPN